MKILLQNQYDGFLGGVETYFKLIIQSLKEKGHEIITVYTQSGRKYKPSNNGHKTFYLPNLDLDEGIYYSRLRINQIKNDLDLLKEIVIKEKPDIVHLNNTYYPRQYLFLNKYVPVIQTIHDFFNCCNTVLKILPDRICSAPLGRKCFNSKCISPKSIMELWRFKTKYLNREAMKRFQKVLVTTPYMKDMLVGNGFSNNKIQVLPLFVEDYKTDCVSYDNVVIFVGRLAKEKGVTHFIHMLKRLSCNFEAFIIGEGPQREEYENLIKALNLNEKVKFTGFLNQNQIRDYYVKASVVVIPSLWPEPFCLVGLEAMSCSRPVVAYNVGGISSWLRDNYNGYLVDRGNVQGLAHSVETILKNKWLMEGLGLNGRRLFEERFSEKIHFEGLFSVYEKVVSENKDFNRKVFTVDFPAISYCKKLTFDLLALNRVRSYPKRLANESLPEYNQRLIKFEIDNKISIVKTYPEEITISTTTRCNMDPPCVICERNLRTKDLEYDIDASILEKLKPIFKYADRIYLHCGGEPLMTEKIFEIIESVQPPTKIIFNTNGALFNDAKIKYMVDVGVVDIISFSLDAATEKTYKRIRSADFHKIISHIETLIDYRNKRNKNKPLLRPLVLLNFCIFKQNIKEVPEYLALAKRLGVDGIDFSHLNQGFDWQQKREDYFFDYKKESVLNMENIEEHDRLISKAYELSKEYNMPINFNGNPFIAGINNEKIKIRNELSELIKYKKICIAPWNRAVIETEGAVRMCYFHHSVYETIGKLKGGRRSGPHYAQYATFDKLWNGSEAVLVRKEFIAKGISKKCINGNPCIFQNRI